MANELSGKRIAFLVSNEGTEQVELTHPWNAMRNAGAEMALVAPDAGRIQAFNHLDKGDTFPVDRTVDEVSADDYDALVLPGGVANPDQLRMNARAVAFVKGFFDAGKPVAAICHAPWTLIEAGVVDGRVMTSWPSLQTDLRNAGAQWHDQPVLVCERGPAHLVTSRKPDDLDAFTNTAIDVFATQTVPVGV